MLTRTAETDTYTPLSPRGNGGTAGTRQTQTASTFDPATGLVTQVSDLGDRSQQSQALCTTYVYPSPVSAAGLLDYPAEIQKVNHACPGTPALVADTSPLLVSDTKYLYDGQARRAESEDDSEGVPDSHTSVPGSGSL